MSPGIAHISRKELQGISPAAMRFIAVLLLMFSTSTVAYSQGSQDMDEIPVSVNVQGVGRLEFTAIIRDQKAYLPITDFFDFIKIRNTVSPSGDSIMGFFISSLAPYVIDYPGSTIILKGKVYNLKPDAIIRVGQLLYLNTEYFGQIFSLTCAFNFRSLSVDIKTSLELPSMREARLDNIRHNIIQLKGDIKADTTIQREYPLFHFGMADWSLVSTQQDGGYSDVRVDLGLGFTAFGGEGYALLNYTSNKPFKERDQYYLWRHANNDRKWLRQVLLGKIFVPAIASLTGPVVGIQLTNTPTTFRRSFGAYTLSNFTKPGWKVELYVNNVLVEYKTADASGFYSFDVPLVYGNSVIKLRFYGLNGEESSREENINIPFNFLPKKVFEYTASAGIVEDKSFSQYGRVNTSYGVTKRMTVGAGMEYLSTIASGKVMPYVNTSMLVLKNLLFNGEYVYGVRSKGILSYRLPSNLQVELNYTKYDKHQTAINSNYLEDRKLIITVPLQGRGFSLYTRLLLDEIVLPALKYRTGELMLSGSFRGVNANVSTYLSLYDEIYPNTYSNVSLGFRLPGGLICTPQFQYEYREKQFVSAKCMVEKNVFRKGYLNLSYEQNFKSKIQNWGLGFRYDLTYAQLGFNSIYGNNHYTLVESGKGSLLRDRPTHLLEFTNHSSQGRGGIIVTAYVDLNGNGSRDLNEPKAAGFKFHINSGHTVSSAKDTNIRVFDLEPYQNYFIEPDCNSLDNISWKVKKQIIGVAVAPNQFTVVDIPVSVIAEVSGGVYINGSRKNGLGRIIVNIYNSESNLVVRLLTEEEGYFSHIGLPPGDYTLRLDKKQIERLGYKSDVETIPFTVKRNIDGDVISDLRFTLTPVK